MISIVLTHFNRADLFQKTLHSLSFRQNLDFELIIVDDGSEQKELNNLKSIIKKYKIKTKLIIIDKNKKWYDNPCIPFNIGVREASGEKIILQSAECIHLGNVLGYIDKNLVPGQYLSFSCYSLDRKQTEGLKENMEQQDLLDVVNPPVNRAITHCEESGWYNHPTYRPLGFHWCNAYMKNDFINNKMFDERYSKGVAYDDNDLDFRFRRELELHIIESPIVLHQWHGLGNYTSQKNPIENQLRQDYNSALLEGVTRTEKNNSNVINSLSKTVTYKTINYNE